MGAGELRHEVFGLRQVLGDLEGKVVGVRVAPMTTRFGEMSAALRGGGWCRGGVGGTQASSGVRRGFLRMAGGDPA